MIARLEELLKRAKDGSLRSVFIVEGYEDSGVNHSWALDRRSSNRLFLAEMMLAQQDFITKIEMDERDSVLCQILDM